MTPWSGVWLTTWVWSSTTGPERMVVVIPWPGVAQAIPIAIPPKAQATKAPATVSFNVFLVIVIPPSGLVGARRESGPRSATALRSPEALQVVAVRTSDGARPLLQSEG